jgi:3-hydroxyanthranilate 3,4-dioxygenase
LGSPFGRGSISELPYIEGMLTPKLLDRIQHNGKPYDILIPEGSIYLPPANMPHAPRRGPNTVGLIVERIRKIGLMDTHRWYCEKCNGMLFEKAVSIEVLERDTPPIFDAYYEIPTTKFCNRNPGRPSKGERDRRICRAKPLARPAKA